MHLRLPHRRPTTSVGPLRVDEPLVYASSLETKTNLFEIGKARVSRITLCSWKQRTPTGNQGIKIDLSPRPLPTTMSTSAPKLLSINSGGLGILHLDSDARAPQALFPNQCDFIQKACSRRLPCFKTLSHYLQLRPRCSENK